ncbi:MAG: hypothetical protein IJT98_08425 [Prevotella sp.]|nr:hypothetical protein [Prevotella sp.]
MKKNILVLIALTITCCSAFAKSWRVNNGTNQDINGYSSIYYFRASEFQSDDWGLSYLPIVQPDFIDLNAAMASDDVQDGDTLMLDPGCLLTTEQIVTKSVTIVGGGYFLDALPYRPARISGYLLLRADGIKIEGLTLDTYSCEVYIQACNITIERCKLREIHIGADNFNAQNTTIRQCFASYISGTGTNGQDIIQDMHSANATIENCIIASRNEYSYIGNSDSNTSDSYGITRLLSPTIRNCYIEGRILHIKDGTINNNIIINTKDCHTVMENIVEPKDFSHNVLSCASSDCVDYPDNIFLETTEAKAVITETATLFSNGGGRTFDDTYYLPAENSPAIGQASDGGDCGPFGGPDPYVLTGLPKGRPYFSDVNNAARSYTGQLELSLHAQLPLPTNGMTISRLEYFFDTDPGVGNGSAIPISSSAEVTVEKATISTAGLESGAHWLGLRARGTAGWSPTLWREVYVEPDEDSFTVDYAEYFWDDDPGYGKATPIAITPGDDIDINNLDIPVDRPSSTLHIRFRGVSHWSPTMSFAVRQSAYGLYTLDAATETSIEEAHYQNLGDALDDFAQRGISSTVTLNVTSTGAEYTLDATTAERLSQLAAITAQLTANEDPHAPKLVNFTAAANSDNCVNVNTTAEGMATVCAFFSQTAWTNVQLNINGTPYDFTPATMRMAETCCATATNPVQLTAISSNINASWKAQPHEGTMLSGFAAEGNGDLPTMTITNSGNEQDYIPYAVTLTDANGTLLCTYTYNIYVHARVGHQTFTTLEPADGSVVEPGDVTLSWNAISDATGYRIQVNNNTVTLDASQTSYVVTGVKSDITYKWKVTAIGCNDQLESQEMKFKGCILLPDLVVESIEGLPSEVLAGSNITIKATIKNQARETLNWNSWRDRFYYTIDSDDFSQAVQLTEIVHQGTVEGGSTYEDELTMQVHFAEGGQLRIFLWSNVYYSQEADYDNNLLCSATSSTILPIALNTDDATALRHIYEDLGGEGWTGTKWNTSSDKASTSNWSGVTFNTDGRVTAINLQGRNLTGSLSTAVPYVETLSQLQSLNLSRNALTGDPALFLSGAAPALTNVNLSYNQIGELSAPLPLTITTPDLSCQNRKDGNYRSFPGFDTQQPLVLNLGNSMTVVLPAMATYNHTSQNFLHRPQITVWKHNATSGLNRVYGKLNWSATNDCYAFTISSYNIEVQPDEIVHLRIESGAMKDSSWPATVAMTLGDANLTGFIDVTDVQATLNYILKGNFNLSLWAANTWNSDDIINIQDIVCTVNLVLENQGEAAAARTAAVDGAFSAATSPVAPAPVAPGNQFYTSGRYLMLDATEPIAAFDVELSGVHADQVRLLLPQSDWQMQTRNTASGVRLVVFSPTGASLPVVSAQQLLKLSAAAEPLRAYASSPDALPVSVAVAGTTTGIVTVSVGSADGSGIVYDLQGRQHNGDANLNKGFYIMNGKKVKR